MRHESPSTVVRVPVDYDVTRITSTDYDRLIRRPLGIWSLEPGYGLVARRVVYVLVTSWLDHFRGGEYGYE